MPRKRRKNKQNKKKYSDNQLIAMLPGMLMSAKILIEDGDSEWKKGDFTGLYVGKTVAAIIISAHCAELLLKYKIAQEGHIRTLRHGRGRGTGAGLPSRLRPLASRP